VFIESRANKTFRHGFQFSETGNGNKSPAQAEHILQGGAVNGLMGMSFYNAIEFKKKVYKHQENV